MPDLSVLIIEDDEVAAEILHKYVTLKQPDAHVEWCWNGYEALVCIEDLKPDVILLDYMMPKVDGKDFLTILKDLESSKNSRIAVVSAYVDKDNEKAFLQMGADEVLSKPATIEQIEAVLIRAIEGRKSTGRLVWRPNSCQALSEM